MAEKSKELTPRQRANLRSHAHSLKPVVMIGKEGVDEDIASAVMDAFQNRELLKVKVLEASPHSAREAADHLVGRVPDSHLVQVIGRTIVLYRPHPDEPRIRV